VFQVERTAAFVGVECLDLIGGRGDMPPRHVDPGGDDLHRAAKVASQIDRDEARPQVGVARQHRCGAMAQQLGVE
jgi:hypothetical protein